MLDCFGWLLEDGDDLDVPVVWILERVDWLLEGIVFEELIGGDVERVLLCRVDDSPENEEEALHWAV